MLRRWAKENGVANKRNLSHVLMDGGVLSVPFDKLDDFYKAYIHDVKSDVKIFVVEQKTELHNFFIDIDYVDDEELGLNQVEAIVKVICDKVNTLGGNKCVISVSKPKPKNGKIKTGIHMNWPEFVVDQKGALALRDHVTNLLGKVYSATKWSEIVKCIDDSVYGSLNKSKGSGFRLPWSHKSVKHKDSSDRVIEGPYLPILMYTGTDGVGPFVIAGSLKHIPQDITMEILKMTSIRTDATVCADIPDPPTSKREGDFTKTQTKNEIKNNELSAYIETFIRKNMIGQKDARITKIFKCKDAYLISTTSMYCENIRRDHGSNHVWFIVDMKGVISQKCFCRCDTTKGRMNGFCKDFTGRKYQLPPSTVKIMYPHNKKLDNIKSAILPNVVINNGRRVNSNNAAIYTNKF